MVLDMKDAMYIFIAFSRLKSAAMPVEAKLDDIKTVSIPGLKTIWKVSSRAGDVLYCEDRCFVRLSPISHTLSALVLEKNDLAPDVLKALPKKVISSSVGLATMISRRNEAQALILQPDCSDEPIAPGEALFGVQQPKKAKKRKSGQKRKAHDTADLASLEISITVAGEEHCLRVVKPLHPGDGLFVEYDAAAMGIVIAFLREAGFDEDQKPRAARDPTLPPGIALRHGKTDRYIVKYKKQDGSFGYKMCDSVDEAVAFQANPVANEESGDEVSGADQGEDSTAGAEGSPADHEEQSDAAEQPSC
jgi:hypothetical protein